MPSSFASSTLPSHSSAPRLLARASSSPSPSPSFKSRRTQRPNRLREKLLESLTLRHHQLLPSPPSPAPSRQPPPPIANDSSAARLAVVHEEAGEEATIFEEEVAAAAAVRSAPQRWFSRDIVGLALRFSLLIAVQTAVAAWMLGGGGGGGSSEEEEEKKCVDENRVGEFSELERRAGEPNEFERKVLEIRSMAKEAREQERKDLAEARRGVKGEVNRRLEKLKKKGKRVTLNGDGYSSSPFYSSKHNGEKLNGETSNPKKKMGFLGSHAASRDVAKGFPGSKKDNNNSNSGNGGIKQIGDHHTLKESELAHGHPEPKNGKSDIRQNQNAVEGFTVSRVQRATKRDGIDKSDMIDEESYLSIDSSTGPSLRGKESMLESQAGQSRERSERKYSVIDGKVSGNSENLPRLINNEPLIVESLDQQFDSRNQTWWLKLPYVLCILLCRGPNHDDLKGLYSLHLSSSSDDENATSYTVAFEDRGDAANFCYLLESFFEELDGATADIVPLTIKELREAVESRESNALVVRKGQVRLYAGQPLAQAEATLCSLIE